MQFSIYTRGYNADYSWKNSQPELNFQEYLGANGLLVARRIDGTFTVYLVSSPTAKTDYMSRKISIAVLVSGCTEAKAKALAVWALKHWDNSADTFSTFVDNFGKDEWTVNNSVFKQWIDNVADVAATDISFENRLGNGNTDASRKELIAELQQFKFNPKTGFKLVVDGGLMTGQRFKDIQYAVDRYLFKDGERKALPDKPVSTEAPTEKTATSKSTGFPLPFLAVLLGLVIGAAGCWLYLDKHPNSPLNEARRSLDAFQKYESPTDLEEKIAQLHRSIGDLTINENELNKRLGIARQEEEKAQQRARDLADGDPTKLRRALQRIEDQLVLEEVRKVVREWLDHQE
jgi:hypothetical protein